MSVEPKPEPSALTVRLKYLGVCALLARVSHQLEEDDRTMVGVALADCAKLWPDHFEVVETSRGGYSLEPKL